MQKEKNTRSLYLIRHGNTGGGKRCISLTDLPLDDFGEFQANNLKLWAAGKPLRAVYSSPLIRAVATAESLGVQQLIIRNELREVDVGLWENLTFDEIKTRFPGDFEERGKYPGTSAPSGGESIMDAGLRLLEYLRGIIAETDGDIAVVSHGGALRGALCGLLGRDFDDVLNLPQPRGGISELEIASDGGISVITVGEMPERYPDDISAAWLRKRYRMTEHVYAHCNTVAVVAARIADGIKSPVDLPLLKSAAELHDISRVKGFSHADEGARLLIESGYPAVAEIVRYHHDLPDNASIEAQILYLADKLVQNDREVSLRERFESSRKKCTTPEALAAWQRRYNAAVSVAVSFGLEDL